jgi:hypothetical protein
MANESGYAVVSPEGLHVVPEYPLLRQLDTLADKTIGELWDYRFKGDLIYRTLEEVLSERIPGIKFVRFEVFGNTHGADEVERLAALPTTLREYRCDAVLSAVGA